MCTAHEGNFVNPPTGTKIARQIKTKNSSSPFLRLWHSLPLKPSTHANPPVQPSTTHERFIVNPFRKNPQLNLAEMQCPSNNSFRFNSSLCACNPGFLYNTTANICSPFTVSGADEFKVGTGVDYSINFPETILSFDSIKKYTQSQGVFLGATLVMIVT